MVAVVLAACALGVAGLALRRLSRRHGPRPGRPRRPRMSAQLPPSWRRGLRCSLRCPPAKLVAAVAALTLGGGGSGLLWGGAVGASRFETNEAFKKAAWDRMQSPGNYGFSPALLREEAPRPPCSAPYPCLHMMTHSLPMRFDRCGVVRRCPLLMADTRRRNGGVSTESSLVTGVKQTEGGGDMRHLLRTSCSLVFQHSSSIQPCSHPRCCPALSLVLISLTRNSSL